MASGRPNRLAKAAQLLLVMLIYVIGLMTGFWLTKNMKPAPAMVVGLSSTDRSARGFSEVFASELSDSSLEGVSISMVVLDEDGQIWFASPLAYTAMCPASALKVLTTGAALANLGPDFRFETKLASQAVVGTSLDGDLVIIGGGDPTLSSDRLAGMVDNLLDSGIRRIDGRVLVDATVFPEHPVSEHWNWGDIGNAYGAGAYGLNVDHNRMVVRFGPGAEPGAPARLLGTSATLPEVDWNNLVVTGRRGSGAGVVVFSEPYGGRVTFRGTVPPDAKEFSVRAAIPNPPQSAVAILTAALRGKGVEITGRIRPDATPQHVLATASSPPLIDIIRSIHQTSDNLEAQCVFLKLAPHGNPVAEVREFWQSRGVSFSALRMLDGSGLARANMIRAVDLARVTHLAISGPHGREFFESLPSYQDGSVRSKPGWMSGVTTSTGTVTTADGRRMTYAFMANGVSDAQTVRNLRGRLRAALSRHAGS